MSILEQYPEFLNLTEVEEYDFETCWTRLNPNSVYETRDIVAAIMAFRGNYTRIAAVLGRSRRSVEQYIQYDPLLRDLREDVRNSILDEIEDGYLDDAVSGDAQARRFFLQTLGKERGYTVRNENTGKDGEPIHMQSKVDMSGLSNEALLELMNAAMPKEG